MANRYVKRLIIFLKWQVIITQPNSLNSLYCYFLAVHYLVNSHFYILTQLLGTELITLRNYYRLFGSEYSTTIPHIETSIWNPQSYFVLPIDDIESTPSRVCGLSILLFMKIKINILLRFTVYCLHVNVSTFNRLFL